MVVVVVVVGAAVSGHAPVADRARLEALGGGSGWRRCRGCTDSEGRINSPSGLRADRRWIGCSAKRIK